MSSARTTHARPRPDRVDLAGAPDTRSPAMVVKLSSPGSSNPATSRSSNVKHCSRSTSPTAAARPISTPTCAPPATGRSNRTPPTLPPPAPTDRAPRLPEPCRARSTRQPLPHRPLRHGRPAGRVGHRSRRELAGEPRRRDAGPRRSRQDRATRETTAAIAQALAPRRSRAYTTGWSRKRPCTTTAWPGQFRATSGDVGGRAKAVGYACSATGWSASAAASRSALGRIRTCASGSGGRRSIP